MRQRRFSETDDFQVHAWIRLLYGEYLLTYFRRTTLTTANVKIFPSRFVKKSFIMILTPIGRTTIAAAMSGMDQIWKSSLLCNVYTVNP